MEPKSPTGIDYLPTTRRVNKMKRRAYARLAPKPLGDGKLIASLLGGIIIGVAVGHVFKTQINQIWGDIPFLKKYPAND